MHSMDGIRVAKVRQPRSSRLSPETPSGTLEYLRTQAAGCRRCDLWRNATQTVFGGGPNDARLMLVGEQPGDQEDLAGEPFVGAAGRVLREALEAAGLDVTRTYLTNAVKHFKWTPRGKRRIHERPNREEILACRVWLDGEIAQVKPHALVALGATAAGVIAGPKVRVTKDRGRRLDSPLAPFVTVTVHPSSILRAPDSESRKDAMRRFVDDLKIVATELKSRR
jgi:DNA polymerase